LAQVQVEVRAAARVTREEKINTADKLSTFEKKTRIHGWMYLIGASRRREPQPLVAVSAGDKVGGAQSRVPQCVTTSSAA
jgi:hypothetical protein